MWIPGGSNPPRRTELREGGRVEGPRRLEQNLAGALDSRHEIGRHQAIEDLMLPVPVHTAPRRIEVDRCCRVALHEARDDVLCAATVKDDLFTDASSLGVLVGELEAGWVQLHSVDLHACLSEGDGIPPAAAEGIDHNRVLCEHLGMFLGEQLWGQRVPALLIQEGQPGAGASSPRSGSLASGDGRESLTGGEPGLKEQCTAA